MARSPHITVRDLAVRYGDYEVMHDVSFTVCRGDVFVIMGGSGSGKSTLLNTMIGLVEPATGEVLYDRKSFTRATPHERQGISRRFGVLFQFGALWSGLTLAENVALPLEELTRLGRGEIRDLAELKLDLVGLGGFTEFYPNEISGGMQKRAGLARAMALDPEILFFDEPSSGLDPVSARRLDDLILDLRDSLRATVVVVTHELSSIFAIGNNSVFLDGESKTMIASGNPRQLLAESKDPRVLAFLTRGEEAGRG